MQQTLGRQSRCAMGTAGYRQAGLHPRNVAQFMVPVPVQSAAAPIRHRDGQPMRCGHTDISRQLVVASVAQESISQSPVSPVPEVDTLPASTRQAIQPFTASADLKEKVKLLIKAGRALPALADADKIATNRVMGCTAQVWVTVNLDSAGKVVIGGGSDSELSAGVVGVISQAFSGLTPHQLLEVNGDELLQRLHLPSTMTAASTSAPSRSNPAGNVLQTIYKRTRALLGELPRFPSLLITADTLQPQGAFAEAQAQYLEPDSKQVADLVQVLSSKQIGVVAHFYMDPQVQGVLSSAAESWPHIAISDSLVMADTAVRMAKGGCKHICVLGVDFMSENVRAILDEAGYKDVSVFRMSDQSIGCSLAEAAESIQYMQYLDQAALTPNSMHVVYINTSLYTKAAANERVPTITCTSSNVVQTVLQGFAQVPDATVWYGPDTYMGRNLAQLFTMLAELPDEEVKALHPAHTAASIKALLPRLKYYDNGTCIVHHIFGGEVCELVRDAYGDAYLTAHFEVPGEMFTLAMAARRRGMGVVGSTSNILDFIAAKVQEAITRPHGDRLQFVLGTESGMVTSIVRKVQSLLRGAKRPDIEVEIVFPVNPKAITTSKQQTSSPTQPAASLPGGLSVLPGPALGEGCSLEGGCASCPYMRMNTLSALRSVCDRVGTSEESLLSAYGPRLYSEHMRDGSTVASAGCKPILYMRHFQQNKSLPDELVSDIVNRGKVH